MGGYWKLFMMNLCRLEGGVTSCRWRLDQRNDLEAKPLELVQVEQGSSF